MTTYRLMDGVSGRPGVGSSGTQPPTSPDGYSGPFQAGLIFAVSQVMWFEGFWFWCPPGGDTGSQTFALWSVALNGGGASAAAGSLIASVTSGTLTAGEFNYIPLSSPVPVSGGIATGAGGGGLFVATTAWEASSGFPDTENQFGNGNPYAAGITNGPLATFGISTVPGGGSPWAADAAGSTFGVAGSDPTSTAPPLATDGSYDLFWLDVQVSDTAPDGYSGSYSLWPNRAGTNAGTVADGDVNYVVATEIDLSESCTISQIGYFSPSGTSQLATRASVWTISTGAETVAVTSPSWSGDAASGWVYCDVPDTPTLAAGKYRVSVYNDNESPDGWSAKDASTAYWDTGEGANGITFGPVTAPQLSAAQDAYEYDASASGATPPYSSGTQEPGQSTFAESGVNAFPSLYVDGLAQNYWVDGVFTPLAAVDQDVTGAAAGVTATGGTGTPSGSSSADVTGVAASVTAASAAGVPFGRAITINPALLGGTVVNSNRYGGSVR